MRRDLEPIETASRDELQALQLTRLKWSLRHAFDNVPHFQRRLSAVGAHPEDLHSLADLAKFPFTTKDDLRDHYPFGMFAVPRDRIVRIHASSGTTGKPTVVGYSAKDIQMWADLVARSIRAASYLPDSSAACWSVCCVDGQANSRSETRMRARYRSGSTQRSVPAMFVAKF